MIAHAIAIAVLCWVAVAPAACLAARAEVPATPSCHAQAPTGSGPESAPDPEACCDPCDGYLVNSAGDAQDADAQALLVRGAHVRPPTPERPSAVVWHPPDCNRSPYARVNPPLLR